jgi:CRP-like cAMP-binding protein
MLETAMEKPRVTDAAFDGNLLLATFQPEVRELLERDATTVELALAERIQRRGEDVEWSYFPFGTTMISLVVTLSDGRTIEVASIGREGAVGGIISCGHAPAFGDARVQVAGPALRVPMHALEAAKRASNFLNNIFCRYSDYLLAQVQQSAACNAFHPIQQRAARWLLTAQDRAGDRIELTQEALAGLLGVQRTTLNAVVGALQEQGVIAVRRGKIFVLDRAGLQSQSCDCHDVLRNHFDAIIGKTGFGRA